MVNTRLGQGCICNGGLVVVEPFYPPASRIRQRLHDLRNGPKAIRWARGRRDLGRS
jgi:hypothetical protein